MTTVTPPPGQLALWPRCPSGRPTSLRVLTRTAVSAPIRNLPIAALQAAAAAGETGEAWLIGPDGTWAHIAGDTGTVAPTTGWAAMAARIIATRRSTTP